MKTLRSFIAAATLAAAFCASAVPGGADLLVSKVDVVGGARLDFDILNDAEITALQFNVVMNSKKPLKLDSGNCVGGLPSTHTGACGFSGNVLKVAIFSPSNATLASGNLGSVTLNIPGAKGVSFEVKNLKMGTAEGREVKAEALLDVGMSLGHENRER